VAARRLARAGHRVGDQEDPARGRGERDQAGGRGHVPQVRDQPGGQPGIGERLADHAGFPVPQRRLRVEEVGDHPGAGLRRRADLLRCRVTVADADPHASPGQPGDGG